MKLLAIIANALLRFLLALLGRVMARSSRRHPVTRSRITRDLVFEITAGDRVARHWSFDGVSRTVDSYPGRAEHADCSLRFQDGKTARRCLFSPKALRAMNDALTSGAAVVEGDPAYLVWFGGLMLRRPRRRRIPGAYVAHDPESAMARYVTVEPPLRELDRSWTQGWKQRAKLPLVRIPAGEPPQEF